MFNVSNVGVVVLVIFDLGGGLEISAVDSNLL